MFRRTILTIAATMGLSCVANAACPNPIPASMDGPTLRACLIEFQKDLASLKSKPSIPRGSIVAFNGPCPDGWSIETLAAGRVILGANPSSINQLSNRPIGQPGGAEVHGHTVSGLEVRGTSQGNDDLGLIAFGAPFQGNPILANKFDNMPPYIAFNFCKKN